MSLSEIRIDQPGTDVDEYFELAGADGTSLDGLTYVVIGDGAGGSGVVEAVVSLAGLSVPASGFFVAAESTFTLGTADVTTSLNFENSDNVTHLLVSGFTGANGDDLDTDDDGVLDSEPWSAVVDSVALIETVGSGDRVYSATTVGPDGPFVPGHVYLCESGWLIGSFDPAGGQDTPGAANNCAPPVPTLIHDIQGPGAVSPMVGANVLIEGVVVGDFQGRLIGTDFDEELSGFFVQEEDDQADADPLTSEGIFVYDPGGTDVNSGDLVQVSGTVTEFRELTQVASVVAVSVIGAGSVTPTPVVLPVTDMADWERYEGMLVNFPQDLYISEFFNFDRHNEIVVTTARQFQPTNVLEPGSPEAAALAAQNQLSRITLDDGRLTQNPDPALHPNGLEFSLSNRFRGGDVLENITGVLNQRPDRFGSPGGSNELQYRIDPTMGAIHRVENPRAGAEDVGGTVKVATFNVLNFFTHLDDGSNDICGPTRNLECRGADTAEELDRQLAKIVAGIIGTGADVVGFQEVENDIHDDEPVYPNRAHDAVLTLVEELNAAEGDGTWAWVGEASHYNDYPVRNDLIYRTASVTPIGPAIALADEAFDRKRPGDVEPVGRPPLAQTFYDSNGEVFTVVVNHFKSKGSPCDSIGDPDAGDGQGNCNLTRVAQAAALMDFVAYLQATTHDDDVLVIGDLNSYAMEDPIDRVKAGADGVVGTGDDFTDLVRLFQGDDAYSYVFDGQLGYLDHSLASASALAQVTGTTVWHSNSDEPDILDYDMSFKQDAQDALYEPNAYRSSDHDPVIVGLDLNGAADFMVGASPDRLWPPNHKYVGVEVSGTDTDGPLSVMLLDAGSSEADCCLDDDDLPNDIVITGDATVDLRAERYTKPDGRTYTLTVYAWDGAGNAWWGEVTVVVPHDQRDKK